MHSLLHTSCALCQVLQQLLQYPKQCNELTEAEWHRFELEGPPISFLHFGICKVYPSLSQDRPDRKFPVTHPEGRVILR